MKDHPQPTPIVASIPATTPFVGPETLERQLGFEFELRLGANESLFGPSPLAVKAMAEQAATGQFYGDPEGFELRQEIAKRHQTTVDHIVLASGIDELLMLFARAFLSPGDSALTTYGSYPTFEYAVSSVGGQFLFAPYTDQGMVDLEELARVVRAGAPKVVYVANPDNPSGTWHGAEAMQSFQNALPSNVLFLLDEAYSDFAPDVEPFNPSNASVVRLRTFSKGYGMAGIRIGYALCAPEHVQTLNKIRMHFGVSSVAQVGALAALRDEAHLKQVVAQTEASRNWLAREMQELGFSSLPSQTNFLTVCIGNEAEAVLMELRKEKVFIRKPMKSLADCIRISIGPQEVMEEFIRRFRAVLKRLSKTDNA